MAERGVVVGSAAPDFALQGVCGDEIVKISSSDLHGEAYLLYFYPRASTPGCTTQACDLRDHVLDIQEQVGRSLKVVGVSPDPLPALKKFIKKHALNFTLLSDEEHVLSECYGVWVEKKLYGRTFMGIERSSFLIDANGCVVSLKRKVRPVSHMQWVQDSVSLLENV